MTESIANCSCFYDLSHWGEFACRLHRFECTHISCFVLFLSLLYCFYFYNILYYVIFHWYWEFFLVEFCKVYGRANTSKYIAPNAFYVLYWLFLFCYDCDMFEFIWLFWYVRPPLCVFVKFCTLLYYFYFYISLVLKPI